MKTTLKLLLLALILSAAPKASAMGAAPEAAKLTINDCPCLTELNKRRK